MHQNRIEIGDTLHNFSQSQAVALDQIQGSFTGNLNRAGEVYMLAKIIKMNHFNSSSSAVFFI